MVSKLVLPLTSCVTLDTLLNPTKMSIPVSKTEDNNTYFMGLLCKLDRILRRTLNKYSTRVASFSPHNLFFLSFLDGINVECKGRAMKRPGLCWNHEKFNEA